MREWLRELELEAGADFGAVRSAYRELVQVWHPDRFGGNAKLEERAQEKLKRINLAYERLRGVMEAEKAAPPPMPRAPASPPPPPPPKATEPERPVAAPGECVESEQVIAPEVWRTVFLVLSSVAVLILVLLSLRGETVPFGLLGLAVAGTVAIVVVSQRMRSVAAPRVSAETGPLFWGMVAVLPVVLAVVVLVVARKQEPSKPEELPPVVADLKVLCVGLPPGGEVMRFCYCPPGQFAMGSPVGEPGHQADENQVSVTISQGFWMAETEVTQGQWQSVMGTNPSYFKGASLPVDSVSWGDAQELLRKLNQNARPPSGFRFALPTEAEWEYACRAGTKTAYAFGRELTNWEANFGSRQTVAVKSYHPNRWGLYDMHGNVWEWCEDWLGDKLQGGVDPKGASSGALRVNRGSSWLKNDVYCRAASRSGNGPGYRGIDLGVRVALVALSREGVVAEGVEPVRRALRVDLKQLEQERLR